MKQVLMLFLMTRILISQTDKMYIGDNKAPAGKKIKTIDFRQNNQVIINE